ncbi:MAG: cupin domain-containing protein [Burkholderiales bacterium]|nr:cupin domain-containing protein [Anaerolineae bacterium]
MAKAGDIMVSAATGETFKFIKTAADTNGELLQIDMVIAPGGGAKAVPAHIHPIQEERFYIKSGQIKFELNGEEFITGPGETVIVPAGASHTWSNATDDEATFLLEMQPALDWEVIFETLCAVSQQGLLGPDGKSSLIGTAVVFDKYKDHMYIAGMPIGLQKVMFAVLGTVGRMMGHKSERSYFMPEVQALRQMTEQPA